MSEVDPTKRRGRPPKPRVDEVVSGETEALVTIVRPEADPEMSQNPIRKVELSPAQVVALDLDKNGSAGGSLPKPRLSPQQRMNFTQAAMEAYSQQCLINRVDSFHRNWSFCVEAVKSHAHVVIRAERGPHVASRVMSTAMFTQQHAEVAIDDLDRETGR